MGFVNAIFTLLPVGVNGQDALVVLLVAFAVFFVLLRYYVEDKRFFKSSQDADGK